MAHTTEYPRSERANKRKAHTDSINKLHPAATKLGKRKHERRVPLALLKPLGKPIYFPERCGPASDVIDSQGQPHLQTFWTRVWSMEILFL
jgi:hypothetical protein